MPLTQRYSLHLLSHHTRTVWLHQIYITLLSILHHLPFSLDRRDSLWYHEEQDVVDMLERM